MVKYRNFISNIEPAQQTKKYHNATYIFFYEYDSLPPLLFNKEHLRGVRDGLKSGGYMGCSQSPHSLE